MFEIEVGERHITVILNHELVALERIAKPEVIEIERVRLVIEPIERDLDRVVQPRATSTRAPRDGARSPAGTRPRSCAARTRAQRVFS